MRSSVAIPPTAAARLRVPHAKAIALIAAQLALVAAMLWFCWPQGLGGRSGWVMVSGTSMLPRLHTGDLVLVEHRSSYHVGEVVAYRVPRGQIGAGHVVIHRIVGGNGRTGWRVNRDVTGSKLLRIPHAWFVLRLLHMPVLLALFAAFGVFFWLALGGADPEGDREGGELE